MTIVGLFSTFKDFRKVLGEIPKVMYANKYNEKPRDITKFAPGCEGTTEFCDLNAFIKRSRQLFFDDVDYQCTTNVTNLNLRKFFEFLFLRNHWMEHEEWL
ncbi:unnamed protein product [Gongylonema pulchrum]|uniref:Uncharacterized protein n=1 Tax=Gongylonema pulchrum TaxID=637853 RepID=A0A183DZ14_9BILA|nr:unnamed protein product [Gongylonema pulchrum]